MAKYYSGGARSSETGGINGVKGDQTGYEVAMSEFPKSFSGFTCGLWVLREKDKPVRDCIGDTMIKICKNDNYGYGQSDRLSGVNSDGTTPSNLDCSSAVRKCLLACGINVPNFTTANEVSVIMATGGFEKLEYKSGMKMYKGDIIVTKVKGHTEVITVGEADTTQTTTQTTTQATKSIETVAKEVINGKWGNGDARKTAITKAGYDYVKVQAKVNEILNGKNTTSYNVDAVAQEVINGKYGNGAARRKAIEAAGYDYLTVQNRVNQLLSK